MKVIKKILQFITSKYFLMVLEIACGSALVGTMVYFEFMSTRNVLLVCLAIVLTVLIFLLMQKKKKDKKTGEMKTPKIRTVLAKLLQVVLSAAMVFAAYNVYITESFLEDVTETEEEEVVPTEIKYDVLVRNTKLVKTIKDLEGRKIGYYTPTNDVAEESRLHQVVTKLNIKIKSTKTNSTVEQISYGTRTKALNALLNKEVACIVIEHDDYLFYKMINDQIDDKTKVLTTYTLKIASAAANAAKVTKEPFAVYISGIDTYGSIKTSSLSDVNMLVVVNPVTKQLLLISIPRDYYVPIAGTYGSDKLTHSAINGIDCTINTVANLLDTKINYYAKFNFSSFKRTIAALGGITINSPYNDFVTRIGFYRIKKGKNKLNAHQALAFVRERHSFSDGDRARAANQQLMIKAIIKKLTSPNGVMKLNKVFKSVRKTIQTNISKKAINSLINMEMDDLATWDVQTYTLNGYGGRTSALSLVTSPTADGLFVMYPYQETITAAQGYIATVMKNEYVSIEAQDLSDITVDPNANDQYR